MDTICPSLPTTIDSGDKQAKPAVAQGIKKPASLAGIKGVDPFVGCHNKRDHMVNGVNATLPDAFYNAMDTNVVIKQEKAQHRMVALLASLGMKNIDIAKETGYTPSHVSDIIRQPWAQEMIQAEIRCRHEEDIMKMFSGSGRKAFMRVVEISEKAQSEQVKLAANCAILDRWLGKPSQHVQVSQKLEELSDAELAKIVSEGRKQ